MPQFDEDHVKVCGGLVVWDAITKPDTNDSGKQKWSLKIVIPPNSPDVALVQALANKKLQESKWRGTLPNGGQMPLGTAGPNEFNGLYNGWAVMNAGTYRGIPPVYDENGAPIDNMKLSNLLYAGQQVDVLVNCYDYDNKAKGVATGLAGFAIIASANAERQSFGGPSVDTASAFGGGVGQQPQYGQQAPAQGQQPQYGQQAPAQGQQPQYGQQAPAQGQQPQYGQQAPAQGQQPQYGQQAPAQGQQPQQAHNFMPNQNQ